MKTESSSKPKVENRTSAHTVEFMCLRIKLPPNDTDPLFEVKAAHLNALRQWFDLCGDFGIVAEMEVA